MDENICRGCGQPEDECVCGDGLPRCSRCGQYPEWCVCNRDLVSDDDDQGDDDDVDDDW